MAEDTFTLTTFYSSWKTYQDHIKAAVEPLTLAQLELRAAPHLRTIGELALHIITCCIGWFTYVMGEDGGEQMKKYAEWEEILHTPGTPIPPATELAQGLDQTWQFMADRLARWSPEEMQQEFPDEWDGKTVMLSRAWIIWHLIEHDLHHGGELSHTLGIHQIPADFPG